jgi:hypothetical protein
MEPAKLTRLVRGELDWIVMKALEKDRGRRYETANGFAQDVERYLADEPVLACPPSAGYRLRKFVRRNRRALATAALLGVMLLAAVAVLTVSLVRMEASFQREVRAHEDLKGEQRKTKLALEQERQASYSQRISRAHLELLFNNNVARADQLLEECPDELRHWEWHYLKRLCHASLLTIGGQGEPVTSLAFSPDGKWLASGGGFRDFHL